MHLQLKTDPTPHWNPVVCHWDLLARQYWRRDPRSGVQAQLDLAVSLKDQHLLIKPQSLRARIAGTLQKFFNAAMDRFLAEQQAAGADPVATEPQNTGLRDVNTESTRSSDRGSNWEYDPDDIDFPAPARRL
ncbi:LOW QUALITY PROTEIN: hypothetical protein PHMEG_00031474 [Phytophthora megakarya]|uniref:Uncharacterized protein n=1 Tax=Phytophthora megakarya TaxID=4795 RepID=A0A225UXM3_9STRA|nr:LOW QUALITY PROTEIN: hypothetical protein PHMEG_00031474 [Phytophthora megakarya]